MIGAWLGILLAAGPADDLAEQTVDVFLVRGVTGALDAPYWDKIVAKNIWVGMQRSVRLGDEHSNTLSPLARQVQVKAVHDGQKLALWVEWADGTQTRPGSDDTDVFGDSVALQFPEKFGAKERLPYIGMGDPNSFVRLYLARAGAAGTILREAIAAGFGSSTRADNGGFQAEMVHHNGRWRAVFFRPLIVADHALNRGRVPFALAIWDGAGHERGGNKALSGWHYLRLLSFPEDPEYLEALRFGYRPEDQGDPVKGKMLAEGVCAACHHVGERRFAHPALAPDLSSIGLIAHPAYLLESIVAPSAVIVPHLNINRHYQKNAAPDAHRAYPNDPQYMWYTKDPQGVLISKMPPFAGFSPEDLKSLVAYLRTLGRPSISGAAHDQN